MGEMRPQELRVGLVGLGYWGPNLLRVLADMQGAEVRSICDRDQQRLEHFAHRHPNVRSSTCIDDLLRDPELDAVVLATPIHTHYDLALESLEAGKHTFVEKPLARSGEEAQALIDLASANDRVLMCGQTFLHSPPVRATKRLIEEGEIGDIYFISSSRVNLGLHQRDVSVIWDLGPHDFSILLYWLDEFPETITTVGRDSVVRGVPDVAFVTLNFPSGVLANIELSWLAPGKLRRTVVVGSKKMVVYEDGSPEPIRVFNHGVDLRGSGDVRPISPLLPNRRHRLAEARLVRADRGRDGRIPAVSARGGRAARSPRARPPRRHARRGRSGLARSRRRAHCARRGRLVRRPVGTVMLRRAKTAAGQGHEPRSYARAYGRGLRPPPCAALQPRGARCVRRTGH